MRPRLILLVILAVALPSFVYGLGFRLVDQDAFATARGEAIVASPDGPSTIFYNPAGITKVDGLTARLGAYGIGLNVDYTTPDGKHFDTIDKIRGAPQVYVTARPPK